MSNFSNKPQIGVSACLARQAVRFDGGFMLFADFGPTKLRFPNKTEGIPRIKFLKADSFLLSFDEKYIKG